MNGAGPQGVAWQKAVAQQFAWQFIKVGHRFRE